MASLEFLVGSRADEVPAQQYPQTQGMPWKLAVSGPGYSPQCSATRTAPAQPSLDHGGHRLVVGAGLLIDRGIV